LRAVLDTNVLISGIVWRGAPNDLVEFIRIGTVKLVTSPVLLAELVRVIHRTKFRPTLARSNTNLDEVLAELVRHAEIVDSPRLRHPVSRDPDDDAVLALAVAAQADIIISGDADLLILGSYAGISIVTPAQALAMIDPPPP